MVWQALKQQCAVEVESVKQEVQHKQRQAARLLKAKAEEEAIKVSPVTHMLSPPPAPGQQSESGQDASSH